MIETQIAENNPDLANLGNVVPSGYSYYEKMTTSGEDLSLPNAYLKWYNIYPTDDPITPEQVSETRAFLQREAASGALKLESELGFVLLHRAGSVLLLLLVTWRNTNEMWESVFVKEAASADSYTQVLFEGNHKATYCVWELGPIWHERNAWMRFLSSPRDNAAKLAYINNRFSGLV